MRCAYLAVTVAIGVVTQTSAVYAEPELAPPPRLAEKNLQVEFMTGGYKLLLSRQSAERLRDGLAKFDNEKAVGDWLRNLAKDSSDEKTAASLELAAFAITNELPKFRKALDTNLGEHGVTITVYGLPRGKDRPVLRALGRALLPPEMQEPARVAMAISRTTPLYWKVEAR
jgi:hypothetical protein